MMRRLLIATGALVLIVVLIFGPASVTAARTDDRIARTGLAFLADFTQRPLDVDRQRSVRMTVAGRDLDVWCAPERGGTADWVCLTLDESLEKAVAAWRSSAPGGPIRELLLTDTDPATVPNR